MEKQSKKMFEIDKGSISKGTAGGHLVCYTTPDHSQGAGYKIKDHAKYYVPVHIVVVENSINRLIDPKKEDVHHIDEDKTNNALSNLKLVPHGEHARDHALKKKFWKKSPRTQPGKKRKAALKIIEKFRNFDGICG